MDGPAAGGVVAGHVAQDDLLALDDGLLHGVKASAATPAPATGDKAAIDKPATEKAN